MINSIEFSQTKSIQVHHQIQRKTNGTYEYPLDPTQFQGIPQVMPIHVNQTLLLNQPTIIMPTTPSQTQGISIRNSKTEMALLDNLNDIYNVE
jgi:hypothetical protein